MGAQMNGGGDSLSFTDLCTGGKARTGGVLRLGQGGDLEVRGLTICIVLE